jgi:hypothetical protein
LKTSSGPVGGRGGATTLTFRGTLHEPASLATLIEYFPASSRSTSKKRNSFNYLKKKSSNEKY